jgi:hypothetical protein
MLLDGADHGLAISGLGPLLFRAVPIAGASKAGQNYSQLGILVPDGIADFSGRSISSGTSFDVTDTLFVQIIEDPVGSQEIETSDIALVALTETTFLFNNIDLTDTLNVSLSETVDLQTSGVLDLTPSDTISVTLTESVVVDVEIAVTDTCSVTATEDAGTVDVLGETFDVTDTCSVSLSESAVLNVFTGVVDITGSDVLSVSVSESSAVVRFTPSDISKIAISMKAPRIILRMK